MAFGGPQSSFSRGLSLGDLPVNKLTRPLTHHTDRMETDCSLTTEPVV